MPSKRKVDGQWRDVSRRYVKVDGQWRAIKAKYIKVGGAWRLAGSFFHVTERVNNPGNFVGTYRTGVMANGQFGATISGGLGNLGQTVRIGIRIVGIKQWASVSFTLDYTASDPTNMILYVLDANGGARASWNSAVSSHSVAWSSWPSDVMDIMVDVSGPAHKTADFTIRDISIDGVKL